MLRSLNLTYSPQKSKQWTVSGMVLAITCRDCTFMAGIVPNLYSSCLWPKTPIISAIHRVEKSHYYSYYATVTIDIGYCKLQIAC